MTYARRIIGHKYYPFMNYQMPEHVYKDADPRLKRLLFFWIMAHMVENRSFMRWFDKLGKARYAIALIQLNATHESEGKHEKI